MNKPPLLVRRSGRYRTGTMRYRYRELSFGPLELRADGIIVLNGMPCPPSTTIKNCMLGDVRLDKDAGPNSPLTLTSPDGSVITIAYDGQQWTSDHDLSQAAPRPYSAPSTHQSLPSGGPRRSYQTLLAVAVAVVALVAAVYLLRPLGSIESIIPTFQSNSREPSPPPPTAPDLLAELRLAHQAATINLDTMQRQMDGFASRFDAAVGRTVEQMNAHPSSWPRQVNFALKESPEFDPAFTRIRTQPLPVAQLAAHRSSLALVAHRITAKTAAAEDMQTLADIVRWSEQKAPDLETHQKALEIVEAVLAKYRDDPRLRPERSSP